MAATFSITLDNNFRLDTGVRVQICVLAGRRQTDHSYSCHHKRSFCGHKQRIQDDKGELAKWGIIDSQIQKVFIVAQLYFAHFRSIVSLLLTSRCHLCIYVKPSCNDFHFWLPFLPSIEFVKFITGSEVEENKRKCVSSRFNDGQFKYEFS